MKKVLFYFVPLLFVLAVVTAIANHFQRNTIANLEEELMDCEQRLLELEMQTSAPPCYD